MKNSPLATLITLQSLAAALIFTASAQASSNQVDHEVLIRLNRPQNSTQQAVETLSSVAVNSGLQSLTRQLLRAESTLASLSASSEIQVKLPKNFPVQILNREEGIVRLRLPSNVSLAEALATLNQQNEVLNVAKNRLYRPSLHLVPHTETRDALIQSRLMPSALEESTSATPPVHAIPNVLLPTPQARGPDALLGSDWAMRAIGIAEAQWNSVQGKPTVTAAVIDTGVDYNHEDLIGAMWRKRGNPTEVGYDFAHNNAKPYDLRVFDVEGCLKDPMCSGGFDQSQFLANPGHGTHCAGHVAAVAGNSVGIRGVAAGSQVMALKFFFDAGEENGGAGSDAGAIQSIDYAIKNGAKVINASWGGNGSREDAEESELKAALVRAQKAGVIVVIAAGNDSRDNDNDETPNWPASYELDNIITVAAMNSKDELADFSAYGARTVHIGAPGVKIFSTIAGGGYDDVVARYKGSDGQIQTMDWDGTSMAAPMVAGAVTAVWSKYPSLNYKQVRARILSSARKVPSLSGKVSSGGVLDLGAALKD